MRLEVTALKSRSLDVDRNEVTWEVEASQVDALDFTFQVLRSESPEGPFDPMTQTFSDRYLFVDSRIPPGDRFRQLWYKLRVVHKATNTIEDFGPVTREADPDLVAQYIRRMEMTAFTQVIGRQVWLLKKRTFGARCSCFDRLTQKAKVSGCLECYGTTYTRGYHNPIEVWMQIDPSSKSKQLQQQQADQNTMTTSRMSFYPNVSVGDVIIEAENNRWRVQSVTRSERLRATIKQEMVLRHIVPTDIEYKIKLDLDQALKDIQPSPGRMFTNPTDVNAAIEERTPNVFANYITYPANAPEE